MEVYTISHHVFFEKNNHEYATAFYPPEDLQVYANLSAAMTKIAEMIVNFSTLHKISIKLPEEERVLENGYSYVSFKYTLSGTEYRESFVITKKELL